MVELCFSYVLFIGQSVFIHVSQLFERMQCGCKYRHKGELVRLQYFFERRRRRAGSYYGVTVFNTLAAHYGGPGLKSCHGTGRLCDCLQYPKTNSGLTPPIIRRPFASGLTFNSSKVTVSVFGATQFVPSSTQSSKPVKKKYGCGIKVFGGMTPYTFVHRLLRHVGMYLLNYTASYCRLP